MDDSPIGAGRSGCFLAAGDGPARRALAGQDVMEEESAAARLFARRVSMAVLQFSKVPPGVMDLGGIVLSEDRLVGPGSCR